MNQPPPHALKAGSAQNAHSSPNLLPQGTVAGSTGSTAATSNAACASEPERESRTQGWKWDVDIYDRNGWSSSHWYGGTIEKREGNEIVISFDTADETGINDDFFVEHYRKVVLSSKDGGMTWGHVDYDLDNDTAVNLSDGTLIQLVRKQNLHTRQEQKARLEKLGIGHVWNDQCRLGWDLWPMHMLDEFQEKSKGTVGASIWTLKTGPTKYHRYLPDGVFATYTPTGLTIRNSSDGGKTWQEGKLRDFSFDEFSRIDGYLSGSVVLPDDTILIPCSGVGKSQTSENHGGVFVLRSMDMGHNWELIDIPNSHPANETTLIYHPTGRVVALIRSGGKDGQIRCSASDDGGTLWKPATTTGIQNIGYPLSGICLKSGNVLCVHARRDFPAGIRATLSYDRGDSWDVENEKILRDDVLPTSFIGGPGVVQLDDESIFTFYSLVKLATPREEDELARDQPLVLNPRFHCYIAGSRYTEDFVRPLGF